MFLDDLGSNAPAPGTTRKYLVLMREAAVEESRRFQIPPPDSNVQ
jgi:hypothetical protein